jgi:hypothetical protein
MALGDLNRIESTFAEATLDPGMWGRALDIVAHETGSFGATLLPLAGVPIPNVPATETVGEAFEHYFRDGPHLIEQRHAGGPLLLKTRLADYSEQRCNLTCVRRRRHAVKNFAQLGHKA